MAENQSERDFALALLIAHGKGEGKLSKPYIKNAIEVTDDMEIPADQLEQYYDIIRNNGIEVVDSTDKDGDENAVMDIMARRRYLIDPSCGIGFKGRMTHREQDLLQYKWALKDGYFHTAKETARKFHISVERVRQIEHKAFRVCRGRDRSKRLRAFLDS